MRKALGLFAALSAALFAGACRRDPPGGASHVTFASDASASSDSGEAPPRCKIDAQRIALPEGEVTVGDAIAMGDEIAVGLVFRKGGAYVAAVARATADLSRIALVELGPAQGDDPPPKLLVKDGRLRVAYYTHRARGQRELALARLEGEAPIAFASVPQQSDESLAFDVSLAGNGLAAWDEDMGARGVVKVISLAASVEGGKPLPIALTGDATDAESPRLAERPGGYWALWLARKIESSEGLGAPRIGGEVKASDLEGPGERRAFQWLELAALDEHGAPVGPPRLLSSRAGHVASFDVIAAGQDLDVLLVDEDARSDGAGGRLVAITAHADRIDPPVELAPVGVGRAAADLLSPAPGSRGPLVAYVDANDRTRLAWFGERRAPTLEPALEGARPLVARGSALVALVMGDARGEGGAGSTAELRRLTCAP